MVIAACIVAHINYCPVNGCGFDESLNLIGELLHRFTRGGTLAHFVILDVESLRIFEIGEPEGFIILVL